MSGKRFDYLSIALIVLGSIFLAQVGLIQAKEDLISGYYRATDLDSNNYKQLLIQMGMEQGVAETLANKEVFMNILKKYRGYAVSLSDKPGGNITEKFTYLDIYNIGDNFSLFPEVPFSENITALSHAAYLDQTPLIKTNGPLWFFHLLLPNGKYLSMRLQFNTVNPRIVIVAYTCFNAGNIPVKGESVYAKTVHAKAVRTFSMLFDYPDSLIKAQNK